MNKTCILFPGQGAHNLNMFAGVDESNFYSVEDFLLPLGVNSFADIETKSTEWIRKNLVSSMLTVAASIIALENNKFEFKIDFFAGYSVGQWTALYASGFITKSQLANIVTERAKIMDEAIARFDSCMISVIGMEEENVKIEIKSLVKQGKTVYLSNLNSIGNYTLALIKTDKEAVIAHFENKGAVKVVEIPTAGGWHSPLLNEAAMKFDTFLSGQNFSTLNSPVIDNVTGEFLPDDHQLIREYLSKHICRAVNWERCIHYLIGNGVERFYEFGAGSMLSRFGFFINRDVVFKPMFV
ncbi:MAG: ACP S-malonyltransferase [Gammaproteobacteria bacterium]|nr:ACP S-malonyltransferase [Gammaproteobacteria bacterium]